MTCLHVYEVIGLDICPACGRDTHETDFKAQSDLHRQWITDGKADWNKCPEGGTIRGWWSI